ncbi:MAG: DNA polymerase III subunit beta [Patescibacteria group bacterium]
MKFSCLQENLYRGLQIARSSVGREQSLPILSHILLTTEKGILSLTATNLEIAVHATVRGKVETEGSIALDAKTLVEFVSLLPKEKVDLTTSSQGILSIQCGGYSTTLHGLSSEDFPLIPSVEKENPITFSLSDIREGLSTTLFAVSLQESRPELSGVLFHSDPVKKTLTIVGTDAYRLAEKTIPAEGELSQNHDVIIPLKTLQEFLRITQYGMGARGELVITDHQLLFLCDSVELYSKRIQGTYPDYKNIIPPSFSTHVRIPRQEFIQAIKASSIFSKAGLHDVQLTVTPKQDGKGLLSLYAANASVGENTTTLDIEMSGGENTVLLNYKYLLDGLSLITSQNVTLDIVDSVNPCVLKPEGGEGYLYLVMPIRQ